MSIKQRLDDDVKQAMKARDSTRVSCLRMLKAKLLEQEVALRGKHGKDHEITDEEAMEVVSSYAKQRRDSIESYEQGGRDDLVAAERAELAIVNEYLPKQLGEDEIRAIVREAMAESGASSMKDLGAVMKLVMPRVKGAADGKLVNQIVREALSA